MKYITYGLLMVIMIILTVLVMVVAYYSSQKDGELDVASYAKKVSVGGGLTMVVGFGMFIWWILGWINKGDYLLSRGLTRV